MLNHTMLGTNDINQSRSFYNAVLGVLGAGEPVENVNDTGQTRLFYIHNGSNFCITEPINGQPVTASNGTTIGFLCDSPEQVQAIHDVAIANGGTSVEEAPGLRDGSMGPMYLCYFLDPDGHKICGIHRPS